MPSGGPGITCPSGWPSGCRTRIVTDAQVIHAYYRERYDAESTFIPYGCEVAKARRSRDARPLRAEPDGYVLYVSRLEPENNALAVIEAFEQTPLDTRLVVVGDAPYAENTRRRSRPAGPACRLHRRRLRRRLSRAAVSRAGLRPRHRSRRHASGAGRGDGIRQLRAGARRAREPRGGRRCGAVLRRGGAGNAGRLLQRVASEPAAGRGRAARARSSALDRRTRGARSPTRTRHS